MSLIRQLFHSGTVGWNVNILNQERGNEWCECYWSLSYEKSTNGYPSDLMVPTDFHVHIQIINANYFTVVKDILQKHQKYSNSNSF